ncbi:MAG: hypothetical protein AMS18_17160 [Gemmatimonas sp. SG8_17]|nr:MAG: hypothetical protein AMS18_17160 [Gemmatimonas sp. SG8_17]
MEMSEAVAVANNIMPCWRRTGLGAAGVGLSLLAVLGLANCLSVQPEDTEAPVPAQHQLRILPSAPTIAPGASLQLRVTIEQPGLEIALPLTWYSSDPHVATVAAQGLVRGVDNGWAVITVRSYNGLEGSLELQVR